MAKRLSLADVGDMYFHYGCLNSRNGIAYANAGVRISGCIENNTLCLPETECLEEVNDSAFVVGLLIAEFFLREGCV